MDRTHRRLPHTGLFAATIILGCLALTGCRRAPTAAVQAPIVPAPAPQTAIHPVTDTYQGPGGSVTVTDNYRWLENASDPAVKAWSSAQNLRARSYISGLQRRDAAAWPKRPNASSTPRPVIHEYDPLVQCPNGLFAFDWTSGKQQKSLVLLRSAASPEPVRTIYDPNAADPAGHTAIVLTTPSKDGRYVGVAEARNGTEDGTLHVYETATGRELPDRIPRVTYPSGGGSIAWSANDDGFFYTRYPRAGERPDGDLYNYQQVYYHKLGAPESSDTHVLGSDFPKIAWTALKTSPDGKYVLASVGNGDGGERAFYLRQASGKWDKIADYADAIVEARFGSDDALYLVSRSQRLAGGTKGAVLRLAAGATNLGDARIIIPQTAAAIDGIVVAAHVLYVLYIYGGPSRLTAFALDGSDRRDVPVPDDSSLGSAICTTGDTLIYQIQSYTQRPAEMQYVPGRTPVPLRNLLRQVNFDYGAIIAKREYAVSKDGTRIPMTIVMRPGVPLDGGNPAVITGYGGYGVSEYPHFAYRTSLWCRAGGIYVYTSIRGGGEFGDTWHRAGNLLNKQNVFDDFSACAQRLIDLGYTRPGKLAAVGASNGGLLMGAMLTQHPDLFKCIVSKVGIYDSLRVELSPNGLSNTTEFGTVRDPAQFAALYAYSPYHQVKDGTHYPDVLMMTGDNDGRVDPMQSRKMMARLQAAAAPGSILLLRTNATSGHGPGTDLKESALESYDQQAFLVEELDMDPARFVFPPVK